MSKPSSVVAATKAAAQTRRTAEEPFRVQRLLVSGSRSLMPKVEAELSRLGKKLDVEQASNGRLREKLLGAHLVLIDPESVSAEQLESVVRVQGRPPVVLISGDQDLLRKLASNGRAGADFVFDSAEGVVPATVRLVQDMNRIKKEERQPVVLLVEDESHWASLLLRKLQESFNQHIPVGLAATFEEAVGLITRQAQTLFTLFTDQGFQKNGARDPRAGEQLILETDRLIPGPARDVAIALFSSEREALEGPPRSERRPLLLHKLDSGFLTKLEKFIHEECGVGPFILRFPNGREWGRVGTPEELLSRLNEIPPEVREHHAKHNHFSTWLYLHNMPRAADEIRELLTTDEYIANAIRNELSLR